MKNRFYKVTNSSPKLGEVPQAEESVMTIATSALTYSLGASATPPNLGGESRYSIRKASVLCTLCSVLCMLMSCSEEQDLLVPEQTNALHITSVTIDGQQVARTRVVTDDDTYDYSMSNQPYNQSFRMFTANDVLTLVTNGLSAGEADTKKFYATYNGTTWTITDPQGGTTPVSLKPAEGKKWANASIEAAFGGGELSGISDDYPSTSQRMDVVQGDIPKNSSIIYRDWLVASTGNGVTINTDLKSPTLGATTIALKHAHALLRLPQSAADVTPGTYIKDGTAHNVTGLSTLWAVLNMSSTNEGEDETATATYCPLTEVTIDGANYLQAIVPSTTANGSYTLTGFKAVMNVTDPSGASATSPNLGEESGSTLTLDLPFKVGTETTASTGIALQPNYRYPLTLNIAPHTASVTLTSPLGKPGWGTDEDEEELSNEMNELLITVDGIQYIKLDGTATDLEKVKYIIETATAAGCTNFYVTGETLAEYDDESDTDDAKTVVGEAIRTSAQGTVSLVLPDATSIGDDAFYYCNALTSVSAPKATSIGSYAFGGCTTLTSLTFGTVITSVDTDAFYGNLSGSTAWTTQCALTLNSGQLSSTDENLAPNGNTWAGYTWASISYVDNDGNAVIDGAATDADAVKAQISDALDAGQSTIYVAGEPGTALKDAINAQANGSIDLVLLDATAIGNEAFFSCSKLASVSAPKATSIGNQAFFSCSKLASVSAPKATSIGTGAFNTCTALTSVSAPKATTIGDYAFRTCTALTSVELPDATTIGESAFGSCTALTSVELPDATTIKDFAFISCSKLASVSAPKAETIGACAFQDCSALTSVELPEATTIGEYAFRNCTALTSLTFGSVITHQNASFNGTLADGTTAWTTQCTLTLNSGQQSSENLAPNGNTWAGYTWAIISYVDDNGNAVEGN